MNKLSIKKGEIIQHEGELDTKVFVVKSGLLRSYSIDENGKENIFMFAPEGWVIADTCRPDKKSVLFIDAIEDSIIVTRPKDIRNVQDNAEALTNRLDVLQQRILMLISSSAIERYTHFVKAYPDIVQRVPQRMIASYLGVTPEALSAAKSKWIRK